MLEDKIMAAEEITAFENTKYEQLENALRSTEKKNSAIQTRQTTCIS